MIIHSFMIIFVSHLVYELCMIICCLELKVFITWDLSCDCKNIFTANPSSLFSLNIPCGLTVSHECFLVIAHQCITDIQVRNCHTFHTWNSLNCHLALCGEWCVYVYTQHVSVAHLRDVFNFNQSSHLHNIWLCFGLWGHISTVTEQIQCMTLTGDYSCRRGSVAFIVKVIWPCWWHPPPWHQPNARMHMNLDTQINS